MSRAIVSGEIDMGITNSFGVIQMADTAGAPHVGRHPKNTVLFLAWQRGGVRQSAASERRAAVYVDFACSAEGQSIINVAGATTLHASRWRARPKAGLGRVFSKPHCAEPA